MRGEEVEADGNRDLRFGVLCARCMDVFCSVESCAGLFLFCLFWFGLQPQGFVQHTTTNTTVQCSVVQQQFAGAAAVMQCYWWCDGWGSTTKTGH